ncbi:hypothetical protein PAECIP111891_02104 [Paenibacillus allorhizoplanae]|uniref:Uncharacterized protein n=1 Tax=Paenibacillus allorhizoplanae TaxID=2905648 RepID=A0ABM9C5J5_9BACL|nr:hypothetical protein PAECIP111891_02104 [Paenibacillus allorhizoplanae]
MYLLSKWIPTASISKQMNTIKETYQGFWIDPRIGAKKRGKSISETGGAEQLMDKYPR